MTERKSALSVVARNDDVVGRNEIELRTGKSRLVDDLLQSLKRRDPELDHDLMQCGLGIQSCYKPQTIAKVIFNKPALLLVVSGSKEILLPNKRYLAKAGEFLVVPADTEFWIGKYPDTSTGIYQGLGFRFDIETIQEFQRSFGQGVDSWNLAPNWHAPASDAALEWVVQWLEWSRKYPVSVQIQRHRLVELLLLFAQAGIAGNILVSRSPSWRQRISQMLSVDPARAWRCQELCRALGVSESAMRRRLQIEGTNFRGLLEEVRLMSGLTMVQETRMTICQVADAVGYQSQSRFTDRFKERFGVTPTALRRSGQAG
ncbi:MAG: helix-turn-helix domain-containing protein [Erythrobacter sp.]|jgi:AraC-like DNA-binding protein